MNKSTEFTSWNLFKLLLCIITLPCMSYSIIIALFVVWQYKGQAQGSINEFGRTHTLLECNNGIHNQFAHHDVLLKIFMLQFSR